MMTDKYWNEDLKIKTDVTIGYLMNKAIDAKCELVDALRKGDAEGIELARGKARMVSTIIRELFDDFCYHIAVEKDEDGDDIIIIENSDTGELLYKYKRI